MSILGAVTITSKLEVYLNEILSEKSQSCVFRGKFGAADVAVKRIAKHLYHVSKKYMQQEHETLHELFEHDNIVRYYDCQELHGMIYLALELCETDLQKYVEQQGVQNLAISLSIASQMCNGLEYLHEKSFVHRDFKPANVLIKTVGNGQIRAKICDMGISKKLDPGRMTYSETGNQGTRGYMPFEVLDACYNGRRAVHLSFSVDIFTLAVTLYFLLSGGNHPFGEAVERDLNILRKKSPDFRNVFLTHEAVKLLQRMMDHCACQR